jgi:hypothetical protein
MFGSIINMFKENKGGIISKALIAGGAVLGLVLITVLTGKKSEDEMVSDEVSDELGESSEDNTFEDSTEIQSDETETPKDV